MKKYKEILKDVSSMDWSDRMGFQVALCVYCASEGEQYSEEEFEGLCKITATVCDDMDNSNMQIIADAICDARFNLGWGYRKRIGKIYKKDFKDLRKDKEDAIIDAVWNRIMG